MQNTQSSSSFFPRQHRAKDRSRLREIQEALLELIHKLTKIETRREQLKAKPCPLSDKSIQNELTQLRDELLRCELAQEKLCNERAELLAQHVGNSFNYGI